MVGCSDDEPTGNHEREYVVNDLVEIAKEYGMEFVPQKDVLYKKLTLEEVSTFKKQLELLQGIKGSYALKSNKEGSAVMQRRNGNFRKLKSRAEAEVKEAEYDYPKYSGGGYICDCRISWYRIIDENKHTTNNYFFVETIVSGMYGTSTHVISNKDAFSGISYDDISCCITFEGCMDYGAPGYGYIKIYYSGTYNPYIEAMNQVSWSFRE